MERKRFPPSYEGTEDWRVSRVYETPPRGEGPPFPVSKPFPPSEEGNQVQSSYSEVTGAGQAVADQQIVVSNVLYSFPPSEEAENLQDKFGPLPPGAAKKYPNDVDDYLT